MKCLELIFIVSLVGFGLMVRSAPVQERSNFWTNIDYNEVVNHMKELMMYLPVLMTTVKETMTGFPKINEGFRANRLLLGSGRQNDGKCRCRNLNKPHSEPSAEEIGYQ